jgi:NAD(P)-dependent dehydrogenase (short-subunit alcohol dehydrogenase family)
MDLGLAHKRAIVTGGSAGIGKEIARRLIAEGVDTAVCSRNLERATLAAKDVAGDGPGRVLPLEMELLEVDSVNAAVQAVVDAWGGVDILINSGADVSGNAPEDFARITDEFIMSAFETKFLGILRCVRAVVPYMRAEHFGRIINIAGHTAREAGSISAGARNSAVVNLTKALAMELGHDGITVNAIHPFTTVTERLDSRLGKMAERRGKEADDHLRDISAKTALGRLVTAAEIADFVTFLSSPLSVSLTGEVVALTGGVGHAVHG